MKKSLIILTLTGALLGGCTAMEKTEKNTTPVATVQTLDISSISGKEYTLENSDITIIFDNNKIYGFSGVNRYFGAIKVEGTTITIGNVASTMMAGLPSKMEEESNYLKTLAEMNSMSIEDNSITLTGNGKTLKFFTK